MSAWGFNTVGNWSWFQVSDEAGAKPDGDFDEPHDVGFFHCSGGLPVVLRPGDFLVINIPAGEGWDKLCPFLGLPVPDAPFPLKNRLAPEPATA